MKEKFMKRFVDDLWQFVFKYKKPPASQRMALIKMLTYLYVFHKLVIRVLRIEVGPTSSPVVCAKSTNEADFVKPCRGDAGK